MIKIFFSLCVAIGFLSGCTLAQKQTYCNYECTVLGGYGIYAKWTGAYSSEVEAAKEGEVLRRRLVSERMIPDNTGVLCLLVDKE